MFSTNKEFLLKCLGYFVKHCSMICHNFLVPSNFVITLFKMTLFLKKVFINCSLILISTVCMYIYIYNPKSEKVGTVWKTQIKKESSDFYIYFDLYFIADNMNTKYFMFCLVNFI